jgi:hypothetical protein
MTFLSPIVLAGLAAIGLPVAIHLLNKMRVKVVRWAATRFLQAAVQKNNRRLQVEDLILLLLRCLVVLALVLAFARPVINPEGGTAAASDSGPYMAVMLLDVTASMGQSNGVEIRLDAARAAAEKALDEMPAGAQSALFLVSDRVNQVVPRPTPNLAVIKSTLAQARPGSRSGGALPGLRAALETLRPLSGARKEILVFTDNQALFWREADSVREELAKFPDVKLRVIPAGEAGEDNVAITAIRPESLVPAVGQLYGCLVEVTNWGKQPVAGLRVTLSLGDGAPSDEAVIDQLVPGQSRTVRLNVRFTEAGYHVLTATIPPDRLPADNARSLALQVVDSLRAAIVEGTSTQQWQDRDGFFITNALAPVSEARRKDYFLKTHLEPAAWLDAADLAKEEIVFLVNVGRLSPAASENLAKYVRAGGSLVIFPGPNVKPADYNDNAALKEILPATLAPLKELSAGTFANWQEKDYRHPVTLLWNDKEAGNLGTVRATKYFPLNAVDAPEPEKPRPLVVYKDGTPAVLERQAGGGRVVLFSSTGTTQWGNLPIHPNFVPFIQRLTGHLSATRSPASLNLAPGAVFTQQVSPDLIGREFQATRPGEEKKPRTAGTVQVKERQGIIRFRDTEEAGPYRLFMGGENRPVGAFAVQTDPAESDLRVATPEELAGLASGGEDSAKSAAAGAAKPVGRRHEFWTALLVIAVIAALAEGALAHRFSLAK